MDPRLDHSRMDHPRAPPLPPPTTTTGAATGEFRMDHHHHHHQQQQQQQQPRMLVELTGGGGRAADPRMMDARMMGQSAQQQHHQHHQHHQNQQGGGRAFEFGFTSGGGGGRREARTLEDLFHGYGVRMATLAKMTEMGFTVSTLVNMTEGELDDVIHTIAELLQMELLVGERYGVKSAIRAEKRHLDEDVERQRLELLTRTDRKRKLDDIASVVVMPPKEGVGEQRRESMMVMPDAVSPVNPLNLNSKEPSLIMGAGHNSLTPSLLGLAEQSSDSEDKRSGKKRQKRRRPKEHGEDGEDRPREHPFIVTEPGEAARGKKNGLDYLFDLYEQCGKFLEQVQQLAREKGEKCPTKVTNQVFRHAKHTGAGYINKPKMRHYVHCYALHCLDVDQSNGMRKLYKERGENVGAWRMACYPPLVAMARDNGWDIEGLFNRNDRLRIWYVPTKLRQLCHVDKGKLESREE